jgi:hypothetical protein
MPKPQMHTISVTLQFPIHLTKQTSKKMKNIFIKIKSTGFFFNFSFYFYPFVLFLVAKRKPKKVGHEEENRKTK